jgi:methylmalonyl-CoA mutase N-terminal domain/subunit
MTQRYNPKHPKSSMLRFHTQVAGVSLTAQQPLNNISRVTIQALAAICGGTQSLHTNSYDEAIGLPTEESATIALRTQQIIAEESGVADVTDPLGGSYHVETLTQQIYDMSVEQISIIEKMGGALSAIEEGWQQREIHNSAFKHLKEVESGERKIIGVNHGVMDEELQHKPMMINAEVEKNQREKLELWRLNRNAAEVDAALSAITDACKTDQNLFPLVISALRVDCTLGEIINSMKEEFGTWMAPSGF